MNTQEYIEKIKNSTLSDKTKQKILALLDGKELTFEIKEEIKDIIQAEIDEETKDLFVTEEDESELEGLNSTLSATSDSIEKDLSDDMDFVDSEMGKVNTAVGELDKMVDEDQIQQIKAKM